MVEMTLAEDSIAAEEGMRVDIEKLVLSRVLCETGVVVDWRVWNQLAT